MNSLHSKLIGATFSALLLSGCGVFDDDDDSTPETPPPPPPAMTSINIKVTNLTAAQPLSPPAIIIHQETYSPFNIGESASVPLEHLAEGGSPAMLVTDAQAQSAHIISLAADALIMPGNSADYRLMIREDQLSGARLSVITMPVNTNDAFAAVKSVQLASLTPNTPTQMNGVSYDAGTEANTESVTSIPGPAAGGEGFNAARDDIQNFVTLHSGVVTNAGGLASSILGEQHRWDNPLIQVRIVRE